MRFEDRVVSPQIDDAQEAFRRVETWIGVAWLSGAGSHALQRLWQRGDFVASLELAILGKSLERMSGQPPQRLKELAKIIKGKDAGNPIGAVYELTTAALLATPGQTVRLAVANQPAHDIEVDVGGRTLRFSCKALLPASVEREFEAFARGLVPALRKCALRGGPLTCVCALWTKGAGAERLKDTIPLEEKHALWLQGEPHESWVGDWWFGFNQLTPDEGFRFSPRHPSFSLLVAAEISGNEEKRIVDKLDEARRNFRTKGTPSTEKEANAVVLRLPPSITMKAAVAAAGAWWSDDSPDLAGVMLTRIQVVSSTDLSVSYPGFQWEWISNPYARYPLPAGLLHCNIPIGESMQTTEIVYQLRVGDHVQALTRGFHRSFGRFVYEIDVPLKQEGQTFTFRRTPGVETTLLLPDGRMDTLGTPPTDAFVFL